MKRPNDPAERESLRRRAEADLDRGRHAARARGPVAAEEAGDLQRVVHELRVHEIELELQNEELRRARQELEVSHEKFRDLYDFAPVGYATLGLDGTIRKANRTLAQLLGVEHTQLIGRRLQNFLAAESPRALLDLIGEAMMGSGVVSGEVALPDDPDGARVVQVQASVRNAGEGDGECRVAVTDITARVRAERERDVLGLRLMEAARLESVGRLAGGVAHEFNNMLGVILGFAELALLRVSIDSPIAADLEHIRSSAERAADLTKKLLAFAARQVVAPRRLDLNATIESSLETVRRIVGDDVVVVWRPGAGEFLVTMDPSHLNQILTVLTINAREAMAGRGRFSISTELVAVRSEAPQPPDQMARASVPRACVQLTIADSGRGMDQATRSRAFEPFFTTNEFGSGSGLGLAAVYGIVRQNGGSIEVESEPGQGATFHIRLGLSTDTRHAVLAPTVAHHRDTARGPRRTVLVAEDEPALRAVLVAALENAGFAVLTAASGQQALRSNDVHAAPVDLLVADLVMPDFGGAQLADQLRRLHPNMRVLLISGSAPQAVSEHGVESEGRYFLQKPFSLRDFTQKIAEIFEPVGAGVRSGR